MVMMMMNKEGTPLQYWFPPISKDEDLTSPFDYSPSYGWQDDTIIDALPLASTCLAYDPLYWPMVDFGPSFPSQIIPQAFDATPVSMFSSNMESNGSVFMPSHDLEMEKVSYIGNYKIDQDMKFSELAEMEGCVESENRNTRRTSQEVIEVQNNNKRNGNINSKTTLSRDEISQYFYMPITAAARELNVGLTFLKKRCRELGICRWPHRKLKSLQTLIKNVQAMDGERNSRKVREAIEVIAYEQRLMEEKPDLQLKDKTKRLRQSYFKANYKKRKLVTRMSLIDTSTSSSNADNGRLDFYTDNDTPYAQGGR